MPELALSFANQYLDTEVVWHQLSTGDTSNRLYRGACLDQQLVLRVNSSGLAGLAVDRVREASILEWIQHQPWAPQLLRNDWERGWCLMSDAGKSIFDEDLHGDLRKPLLSIVADLQRFYSADQALASDYGLLWQRYRSIYADCCKTAPRPTVNAIALFRELLELSWEKMQLLPNTVPCLVHHNLHPKNLCFNKSKESNNRRKSDNGKRSNDERSSNKGQLTLLDWERAGIGSAWFDVASLRRHFSLTSGQIGTLPAFRDYSSLQLLEGLALADWINASLELLWLSVKELQQNKRDRRGKRTGKLLEMVANTVRLLEDGQG